MSSTSTTWSIQGNTKAGGTVSTTDTFTTGTLTADTLQLSSNIIKASDGGTTITLDTNDNVTIGGDLTVASGDITVGADLDGVNRTIVFGHSTLKTRMGIDDSEDKFIINCAATFESTLGDNDFYMDASGARFGQDVTIAGDLTVTGNQITFGNVEYIHNDADEFIAFVASSSDDRMLIAAQSGGAGEDCGFLLYEGANLRWSMQHDASDDTDFALVWDYNNPTAGGATKMKLASDGDLTIAGDLTIDGGNITNALTCDSTVAIADDLTVNGGDVTITAGQDTSPTLTLKADAGDDAGDEWQIEVNHSNQEFIIGCDIASAGTFVDHLKINPDATILDSVVTCGGQLSVQNHITAGNHNDKRGILYLKNGTGSDTPGYILFEQPDGGFSYLWADNSGVIRTSSSEPSDSGGTVVGSQS